MEVRTNLHSAVADVVDQIHDRVQSGALAINWRSAAAQAASGQRRGNRKGPGFEHHGFKEYDPADGDNAAHIDPSASAAESEDDVYIVRLFKRPRLTSLNIAVDVGESMKVGSLLGGFKSYLAAVALGCGIKAAQKGGDRVSVATYNDQPQTIFKLRDPGAVFYQALHAAVEDQGLGTANVAPAGLGAGGLNLALEALRREIRSVYMVVSDFVNMNEDDWDALQACATNHDTIAVFVQDRRECELPEVPWPGMYFRLVDYLGREASFWIAPDRSPRWVLGVFKRLFGSVTTRETYKRNFAAWQQSVLDRLEQSGVTTVVLRNDDEEEAIHSLLRVLAGDRLEAATGP